MTPRKKRLLFVALGLAAVGTATALVLNALNSNVMFFYSPSQIRAGEAPRHAAFRLGGLVEPASLRRMPDGMEVRFTVTDGAVSIPVHYRGLLPALFREGKGVVAAGRLQQEGALFAATEVLAKHDENYMPPEAAAAMKQAHDRKTGTVLPAGASAP
ncbi:cytochrome c maturation protein CcmE [Xylophilus sp.]|uniref:cytochrome c maturation protein CcmE n=1 Tax=Xylophilus sp. TaxID=2653893 RepID=UPI0013BC1974|nr:cytochrome c maturation protein CcmE [Xylophilus sp.]KAF1050151.1 MAG: Cytochrome c-type biogenesis protein CcmE [Xylophilus sp.]